MGEFCDCAAVFFRYIKLFYFACIGACFFCGSGVLFAAIVVVVALSDAVAWVCLVLFNIQCVAAADYDERGVALFDTAINAV